jgi:hypothetical protein
MALLSAGDLCKTRKRRPASSRRSMIGNWKTALTGWKVIGIRATITKWQEWREKMAL